MICLKDVYWGIYNWLVLPSDEAYSVVYTIKTEVDHDSQCVYQYSGSILPYNIPFQTDI